MEILIYLMGAVLGNFLNRCIEYLPRRWTVLFYGHTECEMSHSSFSQRAFVMGITGGVVVLAYAIFGLSAALARTVIFFSFLIIIAVIDYGHQLVLDKVLMVMGVAGIFLRIFCMGTEALPWFDHIIGLFLGGTVLLLIAVISRGGMGGGDIKLAAVIGLWFGWRFILLTLFLSFIVGGVCGLGLVLSGRKGRKDCIPFAPFIAIAAAVNCLYGDVIWSWYAGLMW